MYTLNYPSSCPRLSWLLVQTYMCQGYEQQTHMYPLKTHTVLCQHIETANCATQKDYYEDTKEWVERTRLLATRRKEGSGCEGSGDRGGPFPFKARPTIMKLRYFLVDWRTHYPPFQQELTTLVSLSPLCWCCWGFTLGGVDFVPECSLREDSVFTTHCWICGIHTYMCGRVREQMEKLHVNWMWKE